MALYPYPLAPISVCLTQEEYQSAQRQIYAHAKAGQGGVSMREWVVLFMVTSGAIAGIAFVSGYSSLIFWMMLVFCALYLIARTWGLSWYLNRAFEEEIAKHPMPDMLSNMALGMQHFGLVMQEDKGRMKKNATIRWTDISALIETQDFITLQFAHKGQEGSLIIPKRLKKAGFPLNTLYMHLQDVSCDAKKLQKAS